MRKDKCSECGKEAAILVIHPDCEFEKIWNNKVIPEKKICYWCLQEKQRRNRRGK